jgi:hypothetical protein
VQEQLIQVEQLSTLSLPTHPNALACIEDAMAMQQNERATFFFGILRVEVVD